MASVIARLASANGIRDRSAGRWISRLASANVVARQKIRAASAGDFSLLCFDLIGSLESPPSN